MFSIQPILMDLCLLRPYEGLFVNIRVYFDIRVVRKLESILLLRFSLSGSIIRSYSSYPFTVIDRHLCLPPLDSDLAGAIPMDSAEDRASNADANVGAQRYGLTAMGESVTEPLLYLNKGIIT